MTREKIIELLKDNLQYECYNGFGISEYSINTAEIHDKADELLALFKQELLERLEQLHAEMDERMREELTIDKCALRCPLVEQEKDDLLKEFVEWLKERLKEQYTRLYNGEGTDIIRSIGVHIVMSNLDTHLEKFLDIEKNELAKK